MKLKFAEIFRSKTRDEWTAIFSGMYRNSTKLQILSTTCAKT